MGHNDIFWYRHLERLGRNSLGGTAVLMAQRLPSHLAADEHHADWCDQKGDVAFTTGVGCILGITLRAAADKAHRTSMSSVTVNQDATAPAIQ